jgi:hypothetical protein
MPHAKIIRAIELFGTKVAPEVRRATETAQSGSAATGAVAQV